MSAIKRGTAHLYGIDGTIENATVLDFKNKAQHQNFDTTLDESGNEIERHYDDLVNDATMTLRIRAAYTPPTPGTTLIYQTILYDVVSIEKSFVNKGFRVVSLTLRKTEYVT